MSSCDLCDRHLKTWQRAHERFANLTAPTVQDLEKRIATMHRLNEHLSKCRLVAKATGKPIEHEEFERANRRTRTVDGDRQMKVSRGQWLIHHRKEYDAMCSACDNRQAESRGLCSPCYNRHFRRGVANGVH